MATTIISSNTPRPKKRDKKTICSCYLLGDVDLERERAGLRTGERLRLRLIGDRLGGLRARLGGELSKIKPISTILIYWLIENSTLIDHAE